MLSSIDRQPIEWEVYIGFKCRLMISSRDNFLIHVSSTILAMCQPISTFVLRLLVLCNLLQYVGVSRPLLFLVESSVSSNSYFPSLFYHYSENQSYFNQSYFSLLIPKTWNSFSTLWKTEIPQALECVNSIHCCFVSGSLKCSLVSFIITTRLKTYVSFQIEHRSNGVVRSLYTFCQHSNEN